MSILKKAFLYSSFSALVIKKFKKTSIEEFNFSEIIALRLTTSPNNEMFHSYFSKLQNGIL